MAVSGRYRGTRGRPPLSARDHRGVPLLLASALLVLLAVGCGSSDTPSALDPEGPEAERIAFLWWLMLALAGVVFLIVMGALIAGMTRRRPGPVEDTPGGGESASTGDRLSKGDRRFIVGGGVILPAVILMALGALTVNAVGAIMKPDTDFVVEVTGEQFWWDVRYPDLGVVTANEIHIPTDTEVTLRLESADVIHSFWVPELAGKRDLVPGRTNTLVLEADEPGVYRGQCAEYCGIQHANMAMFVVALDPDEFETWAERNARPAAEPESANQRRGLQVMETNACAGCHTVQGTEADGDLGPDLTHFASRRTIGAGTVPNDLGHLAGWVVDAQSMKPGAPMPPVALEPEELDALLAYLTSLE